jgi:hypothetical protein
MEILIYIIDIVLIMFIINYVWNVSTFIIDLTQFLYEKLNKGKKYMYQPLIKPFGCSSCMVFWVIFIYSLITGVGLLYSIFIALLCSYFGIYLIKLFKNEK